MGLLGREVLGKRCVVRTEKTHYIGTVVGYMYKTGNYQVRIDETIRGRMSPGKIITAKGNTVHDM